MYYKTNSKCSLMSPTLLSQFLAPDPPLCPEAVYHRLLSCELRQKSCLLFLEQFKLQAEAPALLHLCFQGMQAALAERQTVLIINVHLSWLIYGKATGPIQYSWHLKDVSNKLRRHYFWKGDERRPKLISIMCINRFKQYILKCWNQLLDFSALPSGQWQHLSWFW